MSRTNFSSDSSKVLLRIEATASAFLPYISGILLGLILIILTVVIDFKFSTLYYYLVLMAIIFFLIIDHGYRQRNNIKLIELEEKGLNIYKGKKMNKETILFSRITDINIKKQLLSVIIRLKLQGTGGSKASTYNISSDHIRNADLLNLYNEIKRLI